MNPPTVVRERVAALNAAPVPMPFLDINTYHPFYGVSILAAGETARYESLIVCRYGVFMVETRHHDGWIEGDDALPRWTKGYPNGKKYAFPNPLTPREDEARALAAALDIPAAKVFPVLVIRGACELGPGLPDNVVAGGPAAYIRSRREPVFTEEQVSDLRCRLRDIEKKASLAAGCLICETETF